MLKNEYTDNRGLKIPSEELEKNIFFCGKTEQEIRDFLGENYCNKKGALYYFIESFVAQKKWYDGRD